MLSHAGMLCIGGSLYLLYAYLGPVAAGIGAIGFGFLAATAEGR